MSAKEMVAYLNEIKDLDPEWLKWIIDFRPVCKKELAQHPTFLAAKKEGREIYFAGFLGLLNGFYLPNEAIRAEFDDVTGELKGFAVGKANEISPQATAAEAEEIDECPPSCTEPDSEEDNVVLAACSENTQECVHLVEEEKIDHVAVVSQPAVGWDQDEWDRLVAEEEAICNGARNKDERLDAIIAHNESLKEEVEEELAHIPNSLLVSDSDD